MLKPDPPSLDSLTQSAVGESIDVSDPSDDVNEPPTLDLAPVETGGSVDPPSAEDDTSDRMGNSPTSSHNRGGLGSSDLRFLLCGCCSLPFSVNASALSFPTTCIWEGVHTNCNNDLASRRSWKNLFPQVPGPHLPILNRPPVAVPFHRRFCYAFLHVFGI